MRLTLYCIVILLLAICCWECMARPKNDKSSSSENESNSKEKSNSNSKERDDSKEKSNSNSKERDDSKEKSNSKEDSDSKENSNSNSKERDDSKEKSNSKEDSDSKEKSNSNSKERDDSKEKRPSKKENKKCANGKLSKKETDIDCGGKNCPPCADKKKCLANTDCASGFCKNYRCAQRSTKAPSVTTTTQGTTTTEEPTTITTTEAPTTTTEEPTTITTTEAPTTTTEEPTTTTEEPTTITTTEAPTTTTEEPTTITTTEAPTTTTEEPTTTTEEPSTTTEEPSTTTEEPSTTTTEEPTTTTEEPSTTTEEPSTTTTEEPTTTTEEPSTTTEEPSTTTTEEIITTPEEVLQAVVEETTQAQPVCNAVCQNGGSCIGDNVCDCPEGFSGTTCEVQSTGLCFDNDAFEGEPILKVTFGKGSSLFSSASPSEFNFNTTYKQRREPVIHDGYFALLNSIYNHFDSWHTGAKDHTGDEGGYMYLVNANFEPGQFYNGRVDNLCVGLRYEFSVYLANLCKKSGKIEPNVLFEVRSVDGNELLAQLDSGNVPETNTLTWKKYGFSFIATNSSVNLLMISNTPGGSGNDIVIDDIALRVCAHKGSGFCPSK